MSLSVTLSVTPILIRLTRYGDADLSGFVNLADFNRLAANFGTGDVWTEADFNYDGVSNLTDFNLLAGNFGLVATPDGPIPGDWANLAAVVPEPAIAVGMFAALASLCSPRARRPRHPSQGRSLR